MKKILSTILCLFTLLVFSSCNYTPDYTILNKDEYELSNREWDTVITILDSLSYESLDKKTFNEESTIFINTERTLNVGEKEFITYYVDLSSGDVRRSLTLVSTDLNDKSAIMSASQLETFCDIFEFDNTNTHTEHSGEWIIGESAHSYQYTCGCPSPDIAELHSDNDNDGDCDVCGYDMTPNVPPTGTYKLNIIDEQNYILDKPIGKESYFAPETEIVLHANPIMDANLAKVFY